MGASQSDIGQQDHAEDKTVTFVINDKTYAVNPKSQDYPGIGPEYKLVDFIRYHAGHTGTKYMCREGGCGCCCVKVKAHDAAGTLVTRSVNSCLIPIFSCDGWNISTIESLGNRHSGYSELQQRLVKFGGTQCGFCSPGMVMNMNSLLESKSGLKQRDIENAVDGNLCRCTGYRPILDAFKSFASDAPEELKRKACDIEELPCTDCPALAEDFDTIFPISAKTVEFQDGKVWVTATTLSEAFQAIQKFQELHMKYRIVGGNTGSGVFKKDIDGVLGFIDVNHIPELKAVSLDTTVVVFGGGVSLAQGIESLNKAGSLNGFQYANGVAKHWGRIANTPVRNVATIAGNLMIKHTHLDFPSDVFVTLGAVNAELSIASSASQLAQVSIPDFMEMDMSGKLIVSIKLKPLTRNHIYRSFKISRRFQNAHAYVNAAFCMEIDRKRNYLVVGRPNILYGGITNDFIHADLTEKFLMNKSIRDSSVLTGAMRTLETDVKPDSRPPEGSQIYRKRLTQTLLYKCLLGILGTDASIKVRSGAKNIKRNVSHGRQTYDTDKTTWPINKPILKLESFPQVAGEAEYINDLEPKFGELFGAFVLSTVAKGDIVAIDSSEAERLPGVVKFVKASDIPGINNYMIFMENPEEIFASTKVQYVGQPIGLVVATNRDLAFEATELVKVSYANVSKGTLSLEEKLEELEREEPGSSSFSIENPHLDDTSTENLEDLQKVTGEFQMGSQYHMHMETQISICVPKEDGMDIYSSTQWMDIVQSAIATTLGIPCNEINLTVRRIGGAYGSKISRATQVACACAIAAHVTNRPVRVALDLETNMRMIGKRAPFLIKYEATVDDGGKIMGLKGKLFCNTGLEANEETADVAVLYLQSMYEAKGWQITPANISTNTPSNTWCRAPGTTPGIACIENIMEHIAFVLKKDPVSVRMANAIKAGDLLHLNKDEKFKGDNLIPRMIEEMKVSGSIEERKKFINEFNLNNRWKKRGMALVPMRYPLDYFGSTKYPVYVAIYRNDGTVAVSTGGIENGQGINTKVAQAVAFEFGIPMEKVSVKPSNNLVAPNADTTGGSISSELCVFGALMCCKILNERMKPIKDKAKKATWEELVKLCYNAGLSLSSQYMAGPDDKLNNYDIWVVNLTEVEIDCLTGEHKIVRVDIIEDAGKSLNPEIDVGQVEGALVMGIGYWTSEKVIYNSDPPGLLTYNTWSYKPPFAKDIPEDLRITLLKNAPNPLGILRSKATGEPPLCSSIAVLFALKNAIFAARKEAGNTDWFRLDGPATVEDVMLKCLTNPTQFIL